MNKSKILGCILKSIVITVVILFVLSFIFTVVYEIINGVNFTDAVRLLPIMIIFGLFDLLDNPVLLCVALALLAVVFITTFIWSTKSK